MYVLHIYSNIYMELWNCIHYADLSQKIKDSYTPEPDVVCLNTVFDHRNYLEPYICTISGHSKPLCFKFELHDDKCLLEYRDSSDSIWKRIPQPLLKVDNEYNVYNYYVPL